MARTAQTNLKIKNNGVALTGSFNTLDLIGLTGADEGNGVVGITGAAGGVNIDTEVLTGTQSGSSVTLDLTTLPHVFKAIEAVFVNGQAITPITDWSLSGSTITVLNAVAAEIFMVQYTY